MYKFKVGDNVTNSFNNTYGTIERIDAMDDHQPYKVRFSDEEWDYDWFSEAELSRVIVPLEKVKVVYDEVKVIVDHSNNSTETTPEGRKYDSGKPRYSLLPPLALEEIVHVLTFGSQKYEDFNWMKVQNANDRYFSAANRHLWQWKRGEIMDEETKRHHLASAITNLMFILEMELMNGSQTI